MRICQFCKRENVQSNKGAPTCPECSHQRYLIVKRRYQKSAKGQATQRRREEREDVREKRRQYSRSKQARLNRVKYEKTEKGRETRRRAILRYQASEKGKAAAALRHQLTKHLPQRIEQKKRADAKYRTTEKGKVRKHRDYARRKAALVPDQPVTAQDWQEIVARSKGRCFYCKRKKPLTVDHVIPVSKGGKHVKENIVPACQTCNSTKKDKIVMLI